MDSLTAESHAETLAKVTPLLEEGRHEEALPFFELHKSKSDDPIWSYLMALSLACLARGEEGLPLLESAAQSEGFSSYFGISTDLNSLVRTTALNHLMFETSVDASDVGPWNTLRRYAEILQHREFVAKATVGHLKAEPESPQAVAEFLRLFEDAPPDKVIPVLDDIVNGNPNACQPRALLGSFLQQRGKTALAIRHLKTAVDLDPNAMEPHLYLGKIYLAQARFDDAERELSEAMSKGSPTVALLVEVANCQKATYRYDEALQTMFTAFEIDPPTFRHWDLLVDTAQTSGQGDLLADKLREATDKFPQNARLRQRFALMAFRQDDPLAARDQLRATGIFENPTKDQALARLAAEVSWSLNDSATALGLLEALWKASPQNPEACRVYGDALLSDGKPTEAEGLLRETARNNPNDRGLQISWGRALLAMGDAERAHRAFSLASRLDPDDAEAMAEQGRAMLELGLHDEAQNVLKESAKKVDPPLAATLIGLGSVYEKKGLKDISRDFFRQALLLHPDREEAGQGLVRTRPEDGSSSLSEEVKEIVDGLKSPYRKIRLWLNLQRASLLESPDQAKILSREVYPSVAQDLSPKYAAFLQASEVLGLRTLASALERGGDPEKAREVWRFAVSSGRPELSEIASTELKRLDTYEAPAATEDDGLASLFSDAAGSASTAAAPVVEEADLFADETVPAAAPVSAQNGEASDDDDVLAALFAVDVPEMEPARADAIDELFVDETPAIESAPAEADLFVTEEAPQSEAIESSFEIPLPEPVAEPEASAVAEPAEEAVAAEPPVELFAAAPPAEAVAAEPPAEVAQAEPESARPQAAPEAVASAESLSSAEGVSEVVATEATPVEVSNSATLAPEGEVAQAAAAEAVEPTEAPVAEPASVQAEAEEVPVSEAPPTVTVTPETASAEVIAADTAPDETVTPEVAPVLAVAPETAILETVSPETAIPETVTPVAATTETVAPEAILSVAASPAAEATEATVVTSVEFDSDSVASEAEILSSETPAVASQPIPTVPEKELLPIPMAADFSPLTRRQLHYHEALVSGGPAVLNPESLAHLLLQSAVGHEPPDPTSGQGQNSTALLGKALLAGAAELEQAQQFRGAVRVLRTALLYQPESIEAGHALARVQSAWAVWLSSQQEFAHAVSLVRDILARQPESSEAAAQLESLYQQWISWTDANGDTAARDLLSVYLEQEKNAVSQLRQSFAEARARRAAPAVAQQAPPPVEAVKSVAAPAVAPTPADVEPSAPVAPAAVPAAVAPPAPVAQPPVETPAAAPVAAEAAPPAVAPTAAAAPVVEQAAPPSAPVTPPPAPVTAAPAPEPVAEAVPANPSVEPAVELGNEAMFESKEEAIETLDAAPDDESVAEAVFALYTDSMRDLTTLLKERSNANPDQPAWLLLLARAFRRSGSETMAVIQYQKYIKVAPSPQAYEELAQTYEELGKEDFAKMTRRKAERA